MKRILLVAALFGLSTLVSSPAFCLGTLTVTAAVTAPTTDQVFNGEYGTNVTVNGSSHHSWKITGALVSHQYTFNNGAILQFTPGNNGTTIYGTQTTVTTNGVGDSPLITHDLALTGHLYCGLGSTTYNAIATTDADSASPALNYAPAYGSGAHTTNTVRLFTYGN